MDIQAGIWSMSCLALYIQTTMRILKNLLSKEVRHNRFTNEIIEKNGCEVFPAELSSYQLMEVTNWWELKVQELEPDLTFKSDVKMRGELKQPYLRKIPSLWWGQEDCTVSPRQLSVGSWSHTVLFLLPVAKQDGNENEICFTPSASMTQLACSRHQSGCLPLPVAEQQACSTVPGLALALPPICLPFAVCHSPCAAYCLGCKVCAIYGEEKLPLF